MVKIWQSLLVYVMLAGFVSLEVYQASQQKSNKEECASQDFTVQQDLTNPCTVLLANSVVLLVLHHLQVPVVQDTTVMAQQ